MSVDAQTLSVSIIGDSSSAVEAANVSQASLDKLTAAIGELTASFSAHNAAADTAVEAEANVGKAAATSTKELSELTAVGGSAARMFSSLGVSGGEAAARLEAFSGALGGLGALAPEILAVGAALAGLFAGFEFLKDGVVDAENFQRSMTTMGQAIDANGGKFSAISGQIEQFIASESLASGFTRDQLAEALNTLVTSLAGVESSTAAVSDSEKILAVAEETAIAKHKDLIEVVRALQSAEVGRGLALAKLDPRIKELIHDHADLDTILRVLHADNQKQLDDTNSAEMAQARLHVAYAGTGEELGERFLPLITRVSAVMMGSIPAIGDLARALGDGLGGALGIVGHGAAMAYHGILALATAGVGDLKDAKEEFKAFSDQAKDFGKSGYSATVGWMFDAGKAAGDFSTAYTRAENSITASIRKHIAALGDLKTAFDPTMGFEPKGSTSAGAAPGASTYQNENVTNQTRLQDQAERSLTATSSALEQVRGRQFETEAKLAAAVTDATTAQGKASAQQALDAQKTADANQMVGALSAAIANETRQRDQLTQTVANAKNTLDADTRAKNANSLALAGSHKQSLDTKEATAQLAAAVYDAQKQYDDARAALAKYNTEINRHNVELTAAKVVAINAAADEQKQWADLALKWSDFQQKAAVDAADSAAKQQKNGQQLYDYYRQQYEGDLTQFETYLAQKDARAQQWETLTEQAYRNMVNEQNELDQQAFNDYKQVIDKMTNTVEEFVDEVLTKHKNLRTELKTVWDGILQDFLQMLSKMIAAWISSGFMSMFARMFGLGGGSMFGPGGTGWGAGVGGDVAGVSGAMARGGGSGIGGGSSIAPSGFAGGASSVAGSSATAAAVASALGGGSGYAGGASSSGWGGMGGADVGSGGASGSSSVAPAAQILPTLGSGLLGRGGSLGAIGLAGIAGDIIGNMMHPHNEYAGIGGAAGGVGGFLGMEALMANPAFLAALGPWAIPALIGGTLLGALFGGALGGLFGNHFNPADEPDVNQTQQWGQELADLQGSTGGDPMVANGQNFTMDSWTNQSTMGKGWNVLFESFVQMFRNNRKVLPQALQAGFQDLESLWGGATNTADFNGNGKNGMLQIGSGQTAPWTNFWGYVSAYGPAIAQLMSQLTPTDLYAASLNGNATELGGYTPGGDPWNIHGIPDAGMMAGNVGGSSAPQMIAPAGGSKRTVTNVNVYQTFGGSLIADHNYDRRIYQAIEKIPGFSAADIGSVAS